MADTAALIVKGIKQEAARHTVNVDALKIQLPADFDAARNRLTFKFENSGHSMPPELLFDKDNQSPAQAIAVTVTRQGIYVSDTARKDPAAPHADLQICHIQVDRFGQLKEITITVDQKDFFEFCKKLASKSTLFEKLADLKLPENFPSGAPDYGYFSAHAQVLEERSRALWEGTMPQL